MPPFPAKNESSQRRRAFSLRTHRRHGTGFTLIELLAVISIIGILSAILIPVVGIARKSAHQARCLSNLKDLGNAFFLYHAENRELFPRARDADGKTWDTAIGFSAETGTILHCPLDTDERSPGAGVAPRSYSMNDQLMENLDNPQRGISFSSIPNPAKTVLLSEWFAKGNIVGRSDYAWNITPDKVFDSMPYVHGGGSSCHILWMDGHVSLVRKSKLTLEDFLFD